MRGGPWRTEEGGRSGNLLLLQIYRSHTSYASSIDLTSLSYLADGGGHALGVGLHKAVVIEPEEYRVVAKECEHWKILGIKGG